MALKTDPKLIERARNVIDAKTGNFTDLLRTSGLDPRRHLRFADWSGVDFSNCDLRGFDFTGARLHGCNFKSSLIARARFDQAEIDHAGKGTGQRSAWGGSWGSAWGSSWGKPPVRRTNLRAAKDWRAHVKGWRKPEALMPDKHLPVGAVFQDAPSRRRWLSYRRANS